MKKNRYSCTLSFFLIIFHFFTLSCHKKIKESLTLDLLAYFEAAEVIEETQRIDFSDKKTYDFLLKGWSNIEKGGTWATSITSELKFYTFFPDNDQRIVLKCSPFSYPNSPHQFLNL